MGATIVEKIFSMKCKKDVSAGEVVMAPVDNAMIHDITGPLAIRKFHEMGGNKSMTRKGSPCSLTTRSLQTQ